MSTGLLFCEDCDRLMPAPIDGRSFCPHCAQFEPMTPDEVEADRLAAERRAAQEARIDEDFRAMVAMSEWT